MNRLFLSSLLFFLAAFTIRPGLSFALEASEIYGNSKDSVLALKGDGGSGTGFVVFNHFLVTNDHVIDNMSGMAAYTSEGEKIAIEAVLYRNQEDDVAIVSIEKQLPSLALSFGESAIGEKVYVIGNPLGLSFSITDGIISRFDREDDKDVIQFTAPAAQGSSGSPILNEQGEVIGVVHSIMRRQQGFNFGAAVSRIHKGFKRIIRVREALDSVLPKKCSSGADSRACSALGDLFLGVGRLEESSDYFMKGCKLRDPHACEMFSVVRYRSKKVNFDQLVKMIGVVCETFPGSKSCESQKVLAAIQTAEPKLASNAYQFRFGKEVRIYDSEVVDYLNDPFFVRLKTNYPSAKSLMFLDLKSGGSDRKVYGGFSETELPRRMREEIPARSIRKFLQLHGEELKQIVTHEYSKTPEVKLVKFSNKAPYVFQYDVSIEEFKEQIFLILGDEEKVFHVGFLGSAQDAGFSKQLWDLVSKSVSVKDRTKLLDFRKDSSISSMFESISGLVQRLSWLDLVVLVAIVTMVLSGIWKALKFRAKAPTNSKEKRGSDPGSCTVFSPPPALFHRKEIFVVDTPDARALDLVDVLTRMGCRNVKSIGIGLLAKEEAISKDSIVVLAQNLFSEKTLLSFAEARENPVTGGFYLVLIGDFGSQFEYEKYKNQAKVGAEIRMPAQTGRLPELIITALSASEELVQSKADSSEESG